MKENISIFTNWSLIQIAYALGVLALLYLGFEIIFALLIHRRNKTGQSTEEKWIIGGLLKPVRLLFRFGFIYLFFKLIEIPGGAVYPWNIAYNIPLFIILLSGVLLPVFKLINHSIDYFQKRSDQSLLNQDLLLISIKGIKTTFLFLALALIIWKTQSLLPIKLKESQTVQYILIGNGLLISVIILIVIKKSFKSALGVLDNKISVSKISIVLKSLSGPLQMLISGITLLWLKQMIIQASTLYAIIDKTVYLLFLAAILIFIFQMIEIIGGRLSRISVENTNSLDKTLVEMIRMISRISLIFIGVFGIARIITGQPLTTLLAGLGIGGLALALAAQDTLKNFFGSIMIMTDKPFKIGERIKVGEYDGIIETIGFRSTRIRTLVGHQVIIPNDQMASSSIENIGRRPHIRRFTNITITYGTTPDKVELAINIIKNILENHEGMDPEFPPRVYFNEFNADSLNIMMIYWYYPADYWKYMAFTENVNMRIMKEYNKEGIEFAFPTYTTFLEQSDGQSIHFQMDKESGKD